MEPVAPQVKYENGQLTIVAANSTLSDILQAVRKETGAEIDMPDGNERVVTSLGPGAAKEVMAGLLSGSQYNYILLGSAADSRVLTKVVLLARNTASETAPEVVAEAAPIPAHRPQKVEVPSHDDEYRNQAERSSPSPQTYGQAAVIMQPPETEPEPPGSSSQQQPFREPFPVPDPVPEPGTLLLVGSGLLGLAIKAKFKLRNRR